MILAFQVLRFPVLTKAQTPTGFSLQGLRVMHIVVEDLSSGAEEERITRRTLEDQVLVTLRSKAPQLTIDSTSFPYLYVNLSLLSSVAQGYAGFLSLEFVRPVEMLVGADRAGATASRRVWTTATVWDAGTIFRGPRGEAANHIRSILDRLLEQFLADYFRGNP